MSIKAFQKFPPARQAIFQLAEPRGIYFAKHIMRHVTKKQTILDIGVGTGNVTHVLQAAGYKVTALDVQDLSCTSDVKPLLYDGKRIPFKNKSFDVALISTVLHHTTDPEALINEAKRVATQLIIIEDVHNSWLHKHLTQFVDSLLNLEFANHPHSNRTDVQWQKTFKTSGLHLKTVQNMHSFVVMQHRLYVLDT